MIDQEKENTYFDELLRKFQDILKNLFSEGKISISRLEKLVNTFSNSGSGSNENESHDFSTLEDAWSFLIKDHYERATTGKVHASTDLLIQGDNQEQAKEFSFSRTPDILSKGFKKKISTFMSDADRQVITEVFLEDKYTDKAVPLLLNALKARAGESWNKGVVDAQKQEKQFFSRKINEIMVSKYKARNPEKANWSDQEILSYLQDGYKVDAPTYSAILAESCEEATERTDQGEIKPRLGSIWNFGNNTRSLTVWALDITYSDSFMNDLAKEEIQSWQQ